MQNRKPIDKNTVNTRYKPAYHPSVGAGWANDPNGMIWFGGQAHLFYQHYPYDTKWGPMHWGHLVSRDLIRWEELPVALKPDRWYDDQLGCFSGTAIEKDGVLHLMYTGAREDRQQQCLARSADGIRYEKSENNPVIASRDLPEDVSVRDARDPKVFRRGDWFYCMIGTMRQNRGDILLYRSADLEKWQYVGGLMEVDERPDHGPVAGVFECPDYQRVDGQEILITSPQNMPFDGIRFQNDQCSLWTAGTLDLSTGRFSYERFRELDWGFDFYAPQTMVLPDGRTILIGWKEMWNRDFPTAEDGWAGSFTLPRELSFREGHLFQNPVREIEQYRIHPVTVENLAIPESGLTIDGVCGNCLELVLTLKIGSADRAGMKVCKGPGQETLLYYDRTRGGLVFDRSRSGIPVGGREANTQVRFCPLEVEDTLKLRIFLDVSCVEVFLEGGREVMTGNIYPDPGAVGIEFFGNGVEILELRKFDICVE